MIGDVVTKVVAAAACIAMAVVVWKYLRVEWQQIKQEWAADEEARGDLEVLIAERSRHAWIKVNDAHRICTCGATGTWVKKSYPSEYPDGTGLTRQVFVVTAPAHKVDARAARFHDVVQYV